MKRSFSALQQRHSEAVLIAAMENRRNGER
jgi:hypothetical protein